MWTGILTEYLNKVVAIRTNSLADGRMLFLAGRASHHSGYIFGISETGRWSETVRCSREMPKEPQTGRKMPAPAMSMFVCLSLILSLLFLL